MFRDFFEELWPTAVHRKGRLKDGLDRVRLSLSVGIIGQLNRDLRSRLPEAPVAIEVMVRGALREIFAGRQTLD